MADDIEQDWSNQKVDINFPGCWISAIVLLTSISGGICLIAYLIYRLLW